MLRRGFAMMDDNIKWKPFLVTDQSNNLVCLANSKRWKKSLGESLFMTAFINQHHKQSIFYILENLLSI
jgi:hypothetical protein